MKLGVIANCQANGFTDSLKALAPAADIVTVHLNGMADPGQRTPERLEQRAREVEGCDIVFSQPVTADLGAIGTDALTPRLRRLIVIPHIAFDGLHPDCVYVRETDGTELRAAMGPYHPALAFGCYAAGLPVDRALRLFNLHSYAALGYLDAYPAGLEALAARWRACGFDLHRALAEAPPVFMHTVNHPRIEVIFALARQALEQAGIACAAEAALPADRLAESVTWPVYPELGRPLGIAGQMTFVPHRGASQDLRHVVEASYRAFAGAKSFRPGPFIMRAVNFIRQEVQGLPPHPMLQQAGAEDIQAAYRMILGRDIALEQARQLAGARMLLGDLRRGLLKSEEFRKILAALG